MLDIACLKIHNATLNRYCKRQVRHVQTIEAYLSYTGALQDENYTVEEKTVISGNDIPQKETLESLFKDYNGHIFKTNLIDLGDPVGEEKW